MLQCLSLFQILQFSVRIIQLDDFVPMCYLTAKKAQMHMKTNIRKVQDMAKYLVQS